MTGMSAVPLPEVAIRAFLGGGIALAVTLALMPLHLRILRALRVVDSGRKGDSKRLDALHARKRNTPTMGGVAPLLGAAAGTFAAIDAVRPGVCMVLGASIALAAVGAWDDLAKLRRSGHGLWPRAKMAFLLGIGVLYLTMGFRQFSHFFTNIHLALRQGEFDQARQLLAQWRHRAGDRLTSGDIARLAIEEALLSAHRHVFAPLLWFALLGPAGALFYRLAHTFDDHWGRRSEAEFGEFGQFTHKAFALIDWVPIRVTAASFAVVGDFEDAVHCWRTQAVRWPEAGSGILLASGAGALGVRLGMPVHEAIQEMDESADRPELGLGEDADPDFMQSTIGLVWRSLVLGLAVLTLVWISSWVGG